MTAQTPVRESLGRGTWSCPRPPTRPAVLYIDLHLIHEVTSPQAFDVLRARGLPVRRPDRTLATMDHSTPTDTAQIFGGVPITLESAARQVRQLEVNCAEFGVELLGLRDSAARHRAHHRAGTGRHAAGQDHRLRRQPHQHARRVRRARLRHRHHRGRPRAGHAVPAAAQAEDARRQRERQAAGRASTAKDLVLAIIGQIGVNGGTGHVIEYRGSAIEALSMDERMTVCNMSIEAGARAGMIAPDDTTFEYLRGPPVRAAGRGLGRGRRRLAHAAQRSGRGVRQVGDARRQPRSSR